MKFSNGWFSGKQWDKIEVKLRLSFITFFELNIDWTRQEFEMTVLNLKVSL